MTHEEKRIARFIRQLENRITDLEQGRPPETPARKVSTVTEAGLELGPETVSSTNVTDPTAKFNSSDNFGECEFA